MPLNEIFFNQLHNFFTALCKAPVAPENGQIVCENNLLLEGVSCESTCNEGNVLILIFGQQKP